MGQLKDDIEKIATDVVVHQLGGFTVRWTRRELRELALRMATSSASFSTLLVSCMQIYTPTSRTTASPSSSYHEGKIRQVLSERTHYCVREVVVWRLGVATVATAHG